MTETGTLRMGTLKSAVGIGGLLAMGIGDTMRVSLRRSGGGGIRRPGHPQGRRGAEGGPELVSCPTCGRTRIDLIGLATQVEERLKAVDKPITVAVMGCVVNGPGEPPPPTWASPAATGRACSSAREIVKRFPRRPWWTSFSH